MWRELKKRAFLEGKSISAFVRERIEKELGGKSTVYEKVHRELKELSQKVHSVSLTVSTTKHKAFLLVQ